ncbi:MAG TPA: sugar ABC transporter substrate-binding protein [Pseudonocardiaceae bacterium]|nr:sugar ABC transporter substrate-binding protein [Pseudonocardiaceae bacterium]
MARTTMSARVAAGLLFLVTALVLTGCQGAGPSGSSGTNAVDDGTTLTLWTRAPTEAFTKALVDAYNSSHKNKVQLTQFPADSYQQKVASAAGGKQLPDILASDVVYAANYASKGIFADITDRVNTLPFKDKLAPGHVKAATYNGRTYAVPHDLDMSAVFYNKVLFRRAGLDPDKPPTTMQEIYTDAARINQLGGGVHGYFFGGDCPGCMLFTTWPMIWADGGSVLNDKGDASTIDNGKAAAIYSLYRTMYDQGIVPQSVKSENGPTWTQDFANGTIGIQPMGTTALQTMNEGPALQVGVAPIPGLTGGQSSFIGGDVIGITSTSRHAAQAWDFISWTLSEQAQVEVVAKNKNSPVRSDLAANKYAAQDPRLVTFNKLQTIGQTPISVNFGQTYNDPNGPWTAAAFDAVFGSQDAATELRDDNGKISQSLTGGG